GGPCRDRPLPRGQARHRHRRRARHRCGDRGRAGAARRGSHADGARRGARGGARGCAARAARCARGGARVRRGGRGFGAGCVRARGRGGDPGQQRRPVRRHRVRGDAARGVGPHAGREPHRHLPLHPRGDRGDDGGALGAGGERRVHRGAARLPQDGGVHRGQARRRRPHARAGAGNGEAGHHRQRRLPRLHRHRHGRRRRRQPRARAGQDGRGGAEDDHPRQPDGPPDRPRRSRCRGRLALLPRRVRRHGPGAGGGGRRGL
ncbi:MAG: D-beta-hydroxybutyrate dehydrogenase, partial [uncultured Gemmatimonadetes bacterium]